MLSINRVNYKFT
ncbi:hypothetical protein D047_2051, partial [Vibrio parahaemolyticus VPTS-2010_2]